MVKSKGAVWYCHRLAVTLDSPIPPKHTLNGLGILHLLLRPAGLADDAVGVVDNINQVDRVALTPFSMPIFIAFWYGIF